MRQRLTYANVMATVAVFLALGGGAYAATHLAKNSVGAKQLKNNSVTSAKIKNSAVSGAKIAGSAVTGAKVADGSLTGADIDQASLTGVRAGNVTGILVKGDGACSPQVPFPAGLSAQHTGSGACALTFPSSVANCAATATVGFHTGSILITADRTAQTHRDVLNPNQLDVITYQGGSIADLPFDLILVC